MDAERWQQVKAVFAAALDLAPEERMKYIEHACSGDAEMFLEAQSLFAV